MKNEKDRKKEKNGQYNRKQALCIASVASNLDNFNRSNTEILRSLGYEVTLAANFHTKEDINAQEKTDAFARQMRAEQVHIVHIDFSRSLKNAAMQLKSVWQVQKLLRRKFDLIHCHSPICAAIVRAAARKYRRKYGTKVIYTAHGFHFFTGAPLRNWILFYPVEKLMSRFTDVLITINREDYKRAKRKFHAGQTVYVPGVGIDTEKFRNAAVDTEVKRRELGLKKDDIMLLSVGELSARKNHRTVIEALGIQKDVRLHYFIAGIGQLEDEYKELVKKLKLEKHVHFLGYRTDISALCQASDLFIFPSVQEGLPVALMEAMACRIPVICSRIRGNTDLITDSRCLFSPDHPDSIADCLQNITGLNSRKEIAKAMEHVVHCNYERLKNYDLAVVNRHINVLYRRMR